MVSNGSGTPRGTARYSVPQVARMLGISERAVRKRIDAGTLQAERDGNRWLITLAVPGPEPEPVLRGTDAVPPEPGRGTESEPIEAQYRPVAAEASRRYLDELRDAWLLPLIHENGDLRQEIGKVTAERDQAITERDALRIQLELAATNQPREPAEQDESPIDETIAPQTSKNGLLARLWERLKGEPNES